MEIDRNKNHCVQETVYRIKSGQLLSSKKAEENPKMKSLCCTRSYNGGSKRRFIGISGEGPMGIFVLIVLPRNV